MRTWTQPELIYPPRAAGDIPPAAIKSMRGFIGQYKYDDIRVLCYLLPGGEVRFYNRYKEPLRAFGDLSAYASALRELPLAPDRIHVLDGGILRRVPRLVLWDILVHESEYLLGTRYRDRYERMLPWAGPATLLEPTTGHEIGFVVNRRIWLAPWILPEALERELARTTRYSELEGLMLKDPNARLEPGERARWMIRVRTLRLAAPSPSLG